MIYLAYIVLISSALSFATTIHSWQRVMRKSADLTSIRDITGIISKSEIENRFGRPDVRGMYSVRLKALLDARTAASRFFDDPFLDVACFVTGLLFLSRPTMIWLLIPAILYVVVSWGYAGFRAFANLKELKDE